ncbi:MAG: quaternary amine ABC transporter ATP-binding protein [Micrococcaceae bacterium]
MPPKLQARSLVKDYRADAGRRASRSGEITKPAVNGVSFEIYEGEIFVIMGLSGSGKSTVLRMLNRLIEPTSGTLEVDGKNLSELNAKDLRSVRNQTINMVFQHFAIFPHRTVLYNAAYGLKVRGVGKREREERARWALDTVGLSDWADNYPGDLSGGMRQRVGLARGLSTDADILLMDEPFSALDPLIRRDMQSLLLRLHDEFKKTVVFVTHDLNEAMRLGDRIMVMRGGEIVQLGTAEEILSSPADDYVAEFISDVDRSRVVTAERAMEPARLVLDERVSVGEAKQQLTHAGLGSAFVLNSEGLISGVFTSASVNGATPAETSVEQTLEAGFHTVDRNTVLHDCLDLVGKHPVPLGVVDQEQRLVGVLSRTALLNTLSSGKAHQHADA